MRAGHAFSVAIEMAYREFSEPLAGELRRTFEEQNLGQPLEIVLRKLAQRVPSMDVQFFVSAVLLQKRTGGNLAELLDKLAQLMRERFKLRARIRAVSAQGLMSGRILSAIPAGVGVLMFVVNPQYATLLHRRSGGARDAGRRGPGAATGGLPDHQQDCDLRGVAMLELLRAAMFFLLVAARDGLGRTSPAPGAWRARSLHRLAPACGPAAGAAAAASHAGWRELVSRIGSAVPAVARDLAASQAPSDPRRHSPPERGALFPGHPSAGRHPVVRRRRAARSLALAVRRPERLIAVAAAAGAALGYMAPMQYLLLRIRRRQHAIARGLPNALDLMVVCVEVRAWESTRPPCRWPKNCNRPTRKSAANLP